MTAPVYDEHAQSYDDKHQQEVKSSGYPISHFHEYKPKEVRRVLPKLSTPTTKRILDFGCGVGNVAPFIRKYFPDADIYGVDISQESINIAKEKHAEHNISFAAYDITSDESFPFDTGFDMIIVSCVFQHVPRSLHSRMMSCLRDYLAPGGLLFVFEHNPINPVSRTIFKRWDMSIDKDANFIYSWYLKKLARESGLKVKRRSFTIFFPAFLSFLVPLEKALTWLPLGAQYYVAAERV